ncbi:hypothetical protein HDU77_004535, partial [Chytriomyces hyalinus]
AHNQWVALLKEPIDPVDLSVTIASCTHFGAMLDELFLQSNSQNSIDMVAEWDQPCEATEKKFPINRMAWHKLRKCHYIIHRGYTPEIEALLAAKFKRRILVVIPTDNRDYAPLLNAIQNDRMSNIMPTAEILSQLTQLA